MNCCFAYSLTCFPFKKNNTLSSIETTKSAGNRSASLSEVHTTNGSGLLVTSIAMYSVLNKVQARNNFISKIRTVSAICFRADNYSRTSTRTEQCRPSRNRRVTKAEVHRCLQDGKICMVRRKINFPLPLYLCPIQSCSMVGVVMTSNNFRHHSYQR